MDLLERYLRQIERYLPFKERSETTKELRNLILDQLDEAVNNGLDKETTLYNIIVEMGDPHEVANNYVETKPFVSKELEPILRLVLKIVSISLPLSLTFANMLEYVLNNNSTTIMDNLLNITYTIPSTLYSLLIAYGIIFIIFFLVERYIHPNFEMIEKEFNPKLLPKIPTKHFKVSMFESVLTILITTLVIYLFNMQEGLLSIFHEDIREPLLNNSFDKILPLINIGWFITIGLNIYYLFNRRKNIASKTIELIHAIYIGIVFIVLATSNIFNETIINGYNLSFIPIIFKVVFIGIAIVFTIISVIKYVQMYINFETISELDKKKKS